MPLHRIYQNYHPYLITTNTWGRYPAFEDALIAERLMQNIFLFWRQYRFKLYGYAIMPDHVHIILRNNAVDVTQIMRAIKSKLVTNLIQDQLWSGHLWQDRFHDRILHSPTELKRALNYVQNNPVRAGLDQRYRQLPYLFICRHGLERS